MFSTTTHLSSPIEGKKTAETVTGDVTVVSQVKQINWTKSKPSKITKKQDVRIKTKQQNVTKYKIDFGWKITRGCNTPVTPNLLEHQ